jgi:C4-dicarboxylate-specific signal transduction histidine kinase
MDLLQGKRVWMLPLFLAGVVAFVGWWANQQLQSVIEQEIRDNLRATLEANVTALEIWMENQKRMASGLAQDARARGAGQRYERPQPRGATGDRT